jgi:hypothetical protein
VLAIALLPNDDERADAVAEQQLPGSPLPAHSNSSQQQEQDAGEGEEQQQQQLGGSTSSSPASGLSQQQPQDQDMDLDQEQQQQQQQGSGSDASELAADLEAITQEQYRAASDDEASLPAASYAYPALVEQVRRKTGNKAGCCSASW